MTSNNLEIIMNNEVTKKRVFLETYGCQMNEYDSELVRSILTKAGYVFVPQETEADIVMLNTCAIRENAHRKVYGRIHTIRHNRREKLKELNQPDESNKFSKPIFPMIGILGCMATNLRTDLLENRNLKIDFIVGPDSYKRLPQLIEEAALKEGSGKREAGRKPFDVTLSEFETYSDVYPARQPGVNAWIAVMRGCNNFCTFCVVPYTRGRERSRSVANVVDEAKHLVQEGFKQVTLLGQNVNSYEHEGDDFADLMEAVSRVEGLERIRFTSPHPKDFPDKLLEVVTHNPKVCKHIHLPLQSGNNRILDLMSRTYTREEFFALVDKIRTKCPQIALTTDIIIGFSSETDAEFEDTYTAMKTIEFDSAYIFKYSERKGTIAERKFPDDVPDAIKTERIVRLNELQKGISLKKNEAHIGEIQKLLIERTLSSATNDPIGARNDQNKIVMLPANGHKVGDFVRAQITDASPNNLKGVSV